MISEGRPRPASSAASGGRLRGWQPKRGREEPRDAPSRWPIERHGADLLRAALAIAVLAGAGLAAHLGHPTVVEVNLFRLINQLPSPLTAPLLGVMQMGALGAVPVIAFIAVVAGRYRLGAVVAVAGTAAWAGSKFMQWLVDEEAPRLRISQVLLHGSVARSPGLAFPASHVAVAAAVVIVAAPYIGRPARRVGWLLVGLIAVARVYLGLHLPIDVFGGVALGIAVGSLANLVLGVPANGPSFAHLNRLLAAAGLCPADVRSTGEADHLHCTTTDGHEYLVKTLTWDRPDQGWLSRLWRLVAFREIYSPMVPSSPAHRADHEAHLSLLAERGGVRTPPHVLAQDLGRHSSLVVRRWIDAVPLSTVAAPRISDDALVDAWRQLAAVHRAGIVHRRLYPRHLLVDEDDGVWVVGWGAAQVSAHAPERHADIAELAVTLASCAGTGRTVLAATRALGPEPLVAALPHLQPLALGSVARDLAARDPEMLAGLRSGIAALEGKEAPQPLSPTRVAATNLVPVVGVAAAVYFLLPRLAHSSLSLATLRRADWPWVIGIVGGAFMTYLVASVVLMAAAGRRLPLGRTFAVQLAAASTNRVVPAGLGAAATNIRYLELVGLERAEAFTAIGLIAGSGFVVHTVGTIVAVTLLRSRAVTLHVPDLDRTWPALLALGLACAVVGWVLWARKLHLALLRWLRIATGSLTGIAAHPGRIALLLAGSAGISAGYILALAASLAAFGARPGLGTVAGVYLASSAVAAVAPTPGGVGPFEAAAVAGMGTLGVAAGPAVAAVLTYRLITYWLPVAPGAVALHVLRRRGDL